MQGGHNCRVKVKWIPFQGSKNTLKGWVDYIEGGGEGKSVIKDPEVHSSEGDLGMLYSRIGDILMWFQMCFI